MSILLNLLYPIWFPIPNIMYGELPFMIIVIKALVLVALNIENVSRIRIHNLSDMLENPPVIDIREPKLDILLPFGGVDFLKFGEKYVFAMTLISDYAIFHVQ